VSTKRFRQYSVSYIIAFYRRYRIWIVLHGEVEFSFAWYKTVYSRQLALVSGHPRATAADGRFARESGSNRDPAAPYAYSV
jgi:hypothetical protein